MGPSTPPAADPLSDRAPEPPVEDFNGSVTGWIGDLKDGDPRALQPLWGRYFAQLARMIRARLCASRAANAVTDEEDIALSVLHALDEGVRAGRFPRLDDRDNLWKILAYLVRCKLSDRRRKLKALKNPNLRTWREADMIATGSSSGGEPGNPLDRLLADGPSPEMAAEMAEQLRLRLDALTKPEASRSGNSWVTATRRSPPISSARSARSRSACNTSAKFGKRTRPATRPTTPTTREAPHVPSELAR